MGLDRVDSTQLSVERERTEDVQHKPITDAANVSLLPSLYHTFPFWVWGAGGKNINTISISNTIFHHNNFQSFFPLQLWNNFMILFQGHFFRAEK